MSISTLRRFGVYFFDKTLQDIAGTEFRKFVTPSASMFLTM